jgi:hypothetical protein
VDTIVAGWLRRGRARAGGGTPAGFSGTNVLSMLSARLLNCQQLRDRLIVVLVSGLLLSASLSVP